MTTLADQLGLPSGDPLRYVCNDIDTLSAVADLDLLNLGLTISYGALTLKTRIGAATGSQIAFVCDQIDRLQYKANAIVTATSGAVVRTTPTLATRIGSPRGATLTYVCDELDYISDQLNASPSVPSIILQTVITQASTTPSLVKITLGNAQNGVRVFSGDQSVSEDSFYLYVSRNGGAVSKVKMFRWMGRILVGSQGDIFAFGTSDGRSLTMAPVTVPATLDPISGTTGTAACDTAGPPLWSPSAPHVTLVDTGSAFTISADGTERVVFIAERDPNGVWSPLRFVRHSATRDTHVRCNYRYVALANYAGATLSIVAPAGAVIGGVNVPMSLPIPAVTGTSYAPATVAAAKTAIAAAVAGDEIVFQASGSPFAMDVVINRASFVANEASGHKGAEGILIRGSTGVREDVVLTGTSGTNGAWTFTQPGGSPIATRYASFKDLTFDFAALNADLYVGGASYYLQNLLFKNGASTDIVSGDAASWDLHVDALNCRIQDGHSDLWNFNGDAGPHDGASRVRLVNCEGVNAGVASNDQCVTTHNGLDIEVYAGSYSDANTNIIANGGSPNPKTYLFFVTTSPGARAAGITDSVLFGCDVTGSSTLGDATRFSRFASTLASSASLLRQSSIVVTAEHNIITSSGGRADFASVGGVSIFGNILLSSSEGVRLGSASGAQSSIAVSQNTSIGNATGFSFTDANIPSTLRNNAAKTSTNSITVSSGAVGAVTVGDYNTVDPNVSANYTPGAHDIVNADAQLDADYFPTAAGNCDGNGDTSLVDWVGGSDPFGFVLIYKASRVSRGARDIPAIYSGAVLYPDLF